MIFNLQDDHSVYLAPWETCLEDQTLDSNPDYADSDLKLERLEQDPGALLVTFKHFDTLSLDEEFSLALQKTYKEGEITTLILDLRHNYGGYLDTAFNVLGQFFYGKLGYETDKNGTYPLSNAPGRYYRRLRNTEIIVLVDHESHSAAEIVAAVLQLERGATLIGTVSAGNTEILLPYDFLDGSRLWLAVSTFTLRNGVSLEGRGVIPDLIVENEDLVFDKVLEFLAARDNLAENGF
jgi:carboxyl-terminal processing protease